LHFTISVKNNKQNHIKYVGTWTRKKPRRTKRPGRECGPTAGARIPVECQFRAGPTRTVPESPRSTRDFATSELPDGTCPQISINDSILYVSQKHYIYHNWLPKVLVQGFASQRCQVHTVKTVLKPINFIFHILMFQIQLKFIRYVPEICLATLLQIQRFVRERCNVQVAFSRKHLAT